MASSDTWISGPRRCQRSHSLGLDISACLNLGKSHLKYTDLVKTLTTMDRERNLPARFLAMR